MPEEKNNFYLTEQGLEKIKKEYEEVKKTIAFKTSEEEAPKIFESEDLNPDYISFKENIDFLESRAIELEKIIEKAMIIKSPPGGNVGVVDLGAIVEVETGGVGAQFTMVGTLEANPMLGKISNESPVGRALMGKKVGEIVKLNSPEKIAYKIKDIKYNLS